jgi:hypothetical protein
MHGESIARKPWLGSLVGLGSRQCLCITIDVRGVSRNSRTEAIAKYKRVWKLRTSTQLCATWHTDSLDMVVLPYTGASRYHNCSLDGGTSPEYFGCILVLTVPVKQQINTKHINTVWA